MNDFDRSELVKKIRSRFTAETHSESAGMCLTLAFHTAQVLVEAGIVALVQAGSLSWRFRDPHCDDGIQATHFSYMWEPDSPASLIARFAGCLPEIHCWVGLPQTGELVDLSTCDLQIQFGRLMPGDSWSAAKPPDYLWAAAPPDGAVYRVERSATLFAMEALRRRRPAEFQRLLAAAHRLTASRAAMKLGAAGRGFSAKSRPS